MYTVVQPVKVATAVLDVTAAGGVVKAGKAIHKNIREIDLVFLSIFKHSYNNNNTMNLAESMHLSIVIGFSSC